MTHLRCVFALAAALISINALAGPAKDETLKDGSQVTRISGTVSVTCVSGCSGGTGGSGTLGQATMAASSPVVIASNQSALPVNASQSGIWNTRLFDSAGTGITSQASGAQRAVDVGIAVSGVQVDPRTRTWTLSSGTDSISAIESGVWNITNISGTVSLPTGAATSANQASELTKLDTVHTDLTGGTAKFKLWDGTNTLLFNASGQIGISNFPATQPVSGTFWQATQPVSGTFWQATQPVSIASMPSTPVTGTFWQATQPVSFTQPALVAGSALIGKVGIDQTTPGTTNGVQVNAALPAGTNVIGHVIVDTAPSTAVTNAGTFPVQAAITAPTITKGTQGTNGLTTQDLKDAGRTAVSLYVESFAGAATEALLTLNQSSGFAVATTGTSYTVPAGKTFRLTAICASLVATTTTANTSRLRVRVNTAGAVALTSPIAFSMIYGWPSATFIANETQTVCHQLPDGTEIPAGSGVGVTHLEAAANGTVSVQLNGFTY